jgi:N-acetylmuramoyl-L-alanine amidase
VPHAAAPNEMAMRLYSINKWANDNKYDLVLHIHFNDTARYNQVYPGPYTGFSVYVPHSQFGNARGSQAVGRALVEQLSRIHYPSTLPQESGGLVEDQELIAIGAYNTLKPASVLVEYSYIYEQRVQNPTLRQTTLNDMAEATAVGLESFLKD